MGRLNDPDELSRYLQSPSAQRRPLGAGFDTDGPPGEEDHAGSDAVADTQPQPPSDNRPTEVTTSPQPSAGRSEQHRHQLTTFTHWRADFLREHPDLPPVPLPADGETLAPYLTATLEHPHRRAGAPLPLFVHRAWRRHITRTIQRPPASLPPGARTRQDQGVSVAVTFQALHTIARTPTDALTTVVEELARLDLYDRETGPLQHVPFTLPAPAADGYAALLTRLADQGVLRHGWQLQLTTWLYTLRLTEPADTVSSGIAQLDTLAGIGS